MALMRAPQVALVALLGNIFSVVTILVLLPKEGVIAIALGSVAFSSTILIGNLLIAERLRREIVDLRIGLKDLIEFSWEKNFGVYFHW